jgi:hypothetical protein
MESLGWKSQEVRLKETETILCWAGSDSSHPGSVASRDSAIPHRHLPVLIPQACCENKYE